MQTPKPSGRLGLRSDQVALLARYVSHPRLCQSALMAMSQTTTDRTCFIDKQILDLHRPEVGSLNVECVIALVEQILIGHPGDSI